MSEVVRSEIWPTSTGIQDLPENWRSLQRTELRRIVEEWEKTQVRYANSETLDQLRKELHREWAIETGIIENLYDIELGMTRILVEKGFSASLMTKELVSPDPKFVELMLRDQQAALEGLFAFVTQERALSTSYIKELHATMTKSQETVKVFDQDGNPIEATLIRGDYKQHPNYPERGGVMFMYAPPGDQTVSEMERLVAMHHAHVADQIPAEIEAAWLHHRFSQIHPFMDGNGRVARALASLVLIRARLFPLVVPRHEKELYLSTLRQADAGDLMPLIRFIARLQFSQFNKASRYLAAHAPDFDRPEDAAIALADVLRNRDAARTTRTQQRLDALTNAVIAQFQQSIESFVSLLREGFPSAKFKVRGISAGQTDIPNILINHLHEQGLEAGSLRHDSIINIEVGMPANAQLYFFSIAEEYNEAVRAACVFRIGGEELVLDPFSLEFSANLGAEEISEPIKDWVTSIVSSMLNILRRHANSEST